MLNFREMDLSPDVKKAVLNMGFEETTLIQEKTIPLVMEGKDVIGQAQTGTGKTAAFGVPMAEKILGKDNGISALVITPTRELAVQVAEELNRIGNYKGIRALPIYGGQDIARQIRALKKRPQIIVGTPGRLMDHMRRKTVRLQEIKMVVLDEADEMLNMGFREDIESIIKEVPEKRQTLLFSATMPQPIRELANKYLFEPEFISIKPKEVTVPNIEQYYIEVPEKNKFDILCRILDIQSPERSIIFSRTKKRVDELSEALNKRGYCAEGIHGDLTQAKRDSVMTNFKNGNTEILVATDVAARGLDINDVSHVFNFDIPQDPESYVHRIGRTGRIGKAGIATTFVIPRELKLLRLIEQVTRRKLVRKPVPTINEVVEGQQRLAADKIIQAVDQGNIHNYKEMAEELLESRDSVTLLAGALKVLTREHEDVSIKLTEEKPKKISKPWNSNKRKPANFSRKGKGQGKKY